MKFMKQAFSEFYKFHMNDHGVRRDFIAFKMKIISITKHIADTNVVSDVTCTPLSIITHVVIIQHYPLNNSDIIW